MVSLQESLERAVASGCVGRIGEGISELQEQLAAVQVRVERVRRWGGLYAKIELSPLAESLVRCESHR